jgi:hypothetical protein
MKRQQPERRRMRAQGAVIGLALVMGLLGVAFFRVQVLGSGGCRYPRRVGSCTTGTG